MILISFLIINVLELGRMLMLVTVEHNSDFVVA